MTVRRTTNRGISLGGNQKPAASNVRPPAKPAARPVGTHASPSARPKPSSKA